jgi:two-component system chemotaxis response regulator CheB
LSRTIRGAADLLVTPMKPQAGPRGESGHGDFVAAAGADAADNLHEPKFSVVALIASAGGVQALERVLEPLPADLPATLLVGLHQQPERNSHLVDIFARRTRLATELARDGSRMRPGLLLITPPGRHLIVTGDGSVGLIDAGPLPPARPSADLMLATLAVSYRRRALAVILTGMGHDGQAGVRAMAHCGGTVIAQDEATSLYYGMPGAAIATDLVQEVLPLEKIGPAIVRHVAGEAVS